jgi:signal transduction histidine kinase
MTEAELITHIILPGQRLNLGIKPGVPWGFGTSGGGSIEVDLNDGYLYYLPPDDFNGVDRINLDYVSLDSHEKKEVKFEILVANIFRPRARLIQTIGQELISSNIIALVELIKNSYDADSTKLKIFLKSIFSDLGSIIVTDNGVGMSYDKIVKVWLEPATPDKKSKGQTTFSTYYGRRYLGEKGIGRFAVHRLGEKITMTSRAMLPGSELLPYETKVVIDWSEFTEDKYLNEIPIKVEKISPPVVFADHSGTEVNIENIFPWKDQQSVIEAVTKIRGLESPVKPELAKLHKSDLNNDPGFSISIQTNDPELDKKIKEVKSLEEVLQSAFYKFTAIISSNGSISYNYIFDRVDYQEISRGYKDNSLKIPAEKEQDNLINYDPDWFETHPLRDENSPGDFEVKFYAWDLDTSAMKIAGLSEYKKTIIQPNSGVRIFRDNFRVWPYGEPDNDWLSLDEKRLNSPSDRSVSRKQIIGIVHISSIENSKLKDQSNREGLIENEQYLQFHKLISSAFTLFARERKRDKIKIDSLAIKNNLNDSVTESLDTLREKIERNSHSDLYNENIDLIESSYKEKVNDILERYMMAAAIGISYSLPIHELKLRLTSIKHVIEDLQSNPVLQDQYFRKLLEIVKETDDIIKAVTSIMSRQKLQKTSLYKVARNIEILKDSELKKHNIDFEIKGDREVEVEAVPGLLNTAVLNLVDNSIFWLRSKKLEMRENQKPFAPRITIEIGKKANGAVFMKVVDNGNGFMDPFELLTEPYYSRKTDGLGLGLFLVKEIVMRINGRLIGFNENGATVEIIFKLG